MKSGVSEFQKSGFSDFQKSGFSDFLKSEFPEFRTSGLLDFPNGFLEIQFSKVSDIRKSDFPDYRYRIHARGDYFQLQIQSPVFFRVISVMFLSPMVHTVTYLC